jgi:hypothetical protein
MHCARFDGPSGTGPRRRAHHNSTRFGAQFDLVRQSGLFEKQLGHSNATGIAIRTIRVVVMDGVRKAEVRSAG